MTKYLGILAYLVKNGKIKETMAILILQQHKNICSIMQSLALAAHASFLKMAVVFI